MKYLDIKGRIVYGSLGMPIGVVSDVVVELNRQRVAGAIVATKGIVRSFRYVPMRRMKVAYGQLRAEGIGFPIRRAFLRRNSSSLGTKLLGTQVLNGNLVSAGRLVDFIFNMDTTKLQSLIVSKSYFDDVFQGSSSIRCESGVRRASNGIIVENTHCNEKKADEIPKSGE